MLVVSGPKAPGGLLCGSDRPSPLAIFALALAFRKDVVDMIEDPSAFVKTLRFGGQHSSGPPWKWREEPTSTVGVENWSFLVEGAMDSTSRIESAPDTKQGFGFGVPKPCELEGATPSKEGPRILRVPHISI